MILNSKNEEIEKSENYPIVGAEKITFGRYSTREYYSVFLKNVVYNVHLDFLENTLRMSRATEHRTFEVYLE